MQVVLALVLWGQQGDVSQAMEGYVATVMWVLVSSAPAGSVSSQGYHLKLLHMPLLTFCILELSLGESFIQSLIHSLTSSFFLAHLPSVLWRMHTEYLSFL